MSLAIPGPIEARKAWEDTESWKPAVVVRRHRQGVVVEIEGEELYLGCSQPFPIRLPDQLAYSEARGLLAAAHQEGPVISLAPEHGVFSMLGGGDRYIFIRVVPADPSEAETTCIMCRYPTGFKGEDLCEGHKSLGVGNVYRGSRFGKAERAASSAAFDHEPGRLRRAVEELADLAFPLEARRLVDKFTPVIDQYSDPAIRSVLAHSLAGLARRTGDPTLVDALTNRARSDLRGVMIFSDPIAGRRSPETSSSNE